MHSFRSKTHILCIFTPFQCSKTSIWFRTTNFTSKTRVSCGFMPFCWWTWPIVKISIGCIKCTNLCLQNHFLFCRNEHANPLFQSKTHVLGGSMPFLSCTWHIAKTGIEAHLLHEFVPLEPFHDFLQQTCTIHYFRSKTQVLDGFVPFCCRTRPATKISIGVHLKHEFVPRIPFLVWSQRTCSIHNFRSKTHIFNSSWYLNSLLHSFWQQLM